MARPAGYQWRPLGLDTDPVPGDPQAVLQEATHLASMARDIAGQITALRKIASDDTEAGEHAQKIRSTALSLVRSLQAVATRYDRVSAALAGWAGELEQAQALSVRALNQAEAPYAKLSQAAAAPPVTGLGAAHEAEAAARRAWIQRAQGELADAEALLARATTLRDDQAAYYAAKIGQASDDSLTDHESFWDHFAWLVKDVCTGLEVLATAAAVAAFVLAQFVPGVDVVVDTLVAGAFAASLAATVGRFILADTHNGSWLDFGLDAFACLTFGEGRFLGAAARSLAVRAEAGAEPAMAAELSGGAGAKASELARFADMMGHDAAALAERFAPRLAQTAVKVAKDNYELRGVWKVHASLGALSREAEQFARALAVTSRFSDTMGRIDTLVRASLAASGTGAGLTGTTGLGSLAFGGVAVGGPAATWVDVHIPGVSHWYQTHFEVPTGG